MSQDNSLVIPEGMASPMVQQEPQYVVVQQQSVEHGVGVGDGSPPNPGPSGGGNVPRAPIVQVEIGDDKQDDEIQIVVDKGANSGRRGGARSQRLDSLLSNGSELSLEDQRMLRTRENERKRRTAQKESADKLRNLIPGLNDGKSRKVGEGIVMQKSVEYIEKLEAELKILRQRELQASASNNNFREYHKVFVNNFIKHHKALACAVFYHQEALKMQTIQKAPHNVLNINFKDLQPTMYQNMPVMRTPQLFQYFQSSIGKFKHAVMTGSFTTPLDKLLAAVQQQKMLCSVPACSSPAVRGQGVPNRNAGFIPIANFARVVQQGARQQLMLTGPPGQGHLQNRVRIISNLKQETNEGFGSHVIVCREQQREVGTAQRLALCEGPTSSGFVDAKSLPVPLGTIKQEPCDEMEVDNYDRDNTQLILTPSEIKTEQPNVEFDAESQSVGLLQVKNEIPDPDSGDEDAEEVGIPEIKQEGMDIYHDPMINHPMIQRPRLRGWKFLGMGERIPTDDDSSGDDDDAPLRAGCSFPLGSGRRRLEGRKISSYFPNRASASSIEFPSVEEKKEFLKAGDAMFGNDPLFKYDFIWNGYKWMDDNEEVKKVEGIIAQAWKEVEDERIELDRKQEEEGNKRRKKGGREVGKNKKGRGGGRRRGGSGGGCRR